MSDKKRLLIISSVPVSNYGNLGIEMISNFESLGYEVDYLTKFQSDDPHVIGVYKIKESLLLNLYKFCKRFVPRFLKYTLLKIYTPKKKNNYIIGLNGTIVSPDESKPVVNNETLLSHIHKPYDFVYAIVWQDMITSSSLKAIYDKLRVPVVANAVDFQPITGGCYYLGTCSNYEHECRNCPILGTNNKYDFTNRNFIIKKANYDAIKLGMITNPYMMDFVKRSGLFPENRRLITYHPMDENVYKPLDIELCRRSFGIRAEKKYIIFARYAGKEHKRKGYPLMVESINLFAKNIGNRKEEVLLMLAGSIDYSFERSFDIDVKSVGQLNLDQLIKAYSSADIFLSSSIDDAGPSMVNQSIMCGTPVLSFNIGSALYMVDNDETGYRVPLGDTNAMANALTKHFYLDECYKILIKSKCRNKGLEKGSRKMFSKSIVDFVEVIRKEL